MSKHFITITDENLYNDIVEYCKLNNEKINNFCQRILKEQLLIEKYGDTPFGNVTHEIMTDSNVEIVQLPYELGKVTETITNGNISEKYKEKQVPKEFYGEIKVEEPKKKKIRRL